MRAVGIGALGLIGGLLLGIVLQDVLAQALIDAPGRPSTLGRLLGAFLPGFAVLGAVAAVWLDRRRGGDPGSRGPG